MSSFQIVNSVQMRGETCWVCGIQFAMPERWASKRSQNGKGFSCPAGCSLSYGESEVSKLQERLASAQDQTDAQRKLTRHANARTAKERASHSATKGHLTRNKKRVAAGVCPCCNRTFKALARHMKNKHPEYAD